MKQQTKRGWRGKRSCTEVDKKNGMSVLLLPKNHYLIYRENFAAYILLDKLHSLRQTSLPEKWRTGDGRRRRVERRVRAERRGVQRREVVAAEREVGDVGELD